MANPGRPKSKSKYKWNKDRSLALEKKVMEMDWKNNSSNSKPFIYRYKRDRPPINAVDLTRITRITRIICASAQQEEQPKDIIDQICSSKELKLLLEKFDLSQVIGSDEARALAIAFPVVKRFLDAVKKFQYNKFSNILSFFNKTKDSLYNLDDMQKRLYEMANIPIWAMTYYMNNPSDELRKEIQAALEQDPKNLNPNISKQDIESIYPILINADIFVSKPTKSELWSCLLADGRKALKTQKIGLLAYFLNKLSEQNKISNYWQQAYGNAKVFVKKNGEPITAKAFSKYLSTAKNESLNLKAKKEEYGFSNENMEQIRSAKLHFYDEIDKLFESCY